MKNLIIALFALLSFNTTYSQISKVETTKPEKIGKIGALGETWIECTKQGNTYTFTYQDMKYQHLKDYKSFSFEDVDNAFENLYQTIMDGLNEMPKDDITLDLPNDILWLKFKKSFGTVTAEFWHAPDKNSEVIGFSIWMNKKRVNKLFGKK